MSAHIQFIQVQYISQPLFQNVIIYSDFVFMKRPGFFFDYELEAWFK